MVEKVAKIDIGVRVMMMLVILSLGIMGALVIESFLSWICLLVGFSALFFHIYIVSVSEKSHHQNIVKYNNDFLLDSKLTYDDYFFR